ncbi:MAG: hypothetical protein ACM3PF_11165 [Bacteroidota bacterium]
MSAGKVALAACLLAATAGAIGCASSRAPSGWLDRPEDLVRSAYGGWVTIEPARGRARVEGELLAVGTDSVYVLGAGGFDAVPRAGMRSARLEVYRAQTGRAAGETTLGTIVSLSHGLGFIISGPIWIITGSIAAGAGSREPLRDVSGATWESVSKYARFPAGMPPGIDRDALLPKRGTGELVVTLENGERMRARRLKASPWMGYVTIDLPDGSRRALDAVRIRSIIDATGRDRTRELLAGH